MEKGDKIELTITINDKVQLKGELVNGKKGRFLMLKKIEGLSSDEYSEGVFELIEIAKIVRTNKRGCPEELEEIKKQIGGVFYERTDIRLIF